MPKLDEAQRDMEICVLVVGGASDAFRDSLPLDNGVLKLGDLGRWRPTVKLHTFGIEPFADEAEAQRLTTLLPTADALVLTDSHEAGHHYSSRTLEGLDRALHLGKPAMPVAVFGGNALASEWGTLSAYKPVYVGDPSQEHAMPIIKALVRGMLRPTTRPPPAQP
ncbi:MAG: hypothetical protein R3B13_18110 [Polyangiaceae bacterium]